MSHTGASHALKPADSGIALSCCGTLPPQTRLQSELSGLAGLHTTGYPVFLRHCRAALVRMQAHGTRLLPLQ